MATEFYSCQVSSYRFERIRWRLVSTVDSLAENLEKVTDEIFRTGKVPLGIVHGRLRDFFPSFPDRNRRQPRFRELPLSVSTGYLRLPLPAPSAGGLALGWVTGGVKT